MTATQSLRNGLRQRVSLAQGDTTSFDSAKMFGREEFDRIFVCYAVSMIPDWTRVLDACERALAAHGELHLLDFGRCEGLPALFKQVLYGWLERFSVTPRADLAGELSRFVGRNNLDIELSRPYRGYALYAVLRRY